MFLDIEPIIRITSLSVKLPPKSDNKSETYELFSQLLLQFRESILNIAKIDDQIYLYTSLKMVYKAILLSNNDDFEGIVFQNQANLYLLCELPNILQFASF